MFDKFLIDYCACTLAAIKIASLFNYYYQNEEELYENIILYNKIFKDKGIELTMLRKSKRSALIYVVRKKQLQKVLDDVKIQTFLKKRGYTDFKADKAIEVLKSRFNEAGFPHEIGVFLDYPLEDVKCFINNNGKNCQHIGFWKVYVNKYETLCRFKKFENCIKAYKMMYQKGRNVLALIVAA